MSRNWTKRKGRNVKRDELGPEGKGLASGSGRRKRKEKGEKQRK